MATKKFEGINLLNNQKQLNRVTYNSIVKRKEANKWSIKHYKDWVHEPHNKSWMNLGAPEGLSVLVPLVAPVMLLS